MSNVASIVSNFQSKQVANNRNYIMQGSKLNKSLAIYHLILAPTHACNLRCKHCYLPDHSKDLLPKEVALSMLEEWSQITLREKGRYNGIFHVKGGEPFVVPYLTDIVDRLVELSSLRFMMTTNGTHSRPRDFDLLQRANDGLDGNITVVVSLDGATSATHDFLRGSGRFDKTMVFLEFLEFLKNAGIQTYLNCVTRSKFIRS